MINVLDLIRPPLRLWDWCITTTTEKNSDKLNKIKQHLNLNKSKLFFLKKTLFCVWVSKFALHWTQKNTKHVCPTHQHCKKRAVEKCEHSVDAIYHVEHSFLFVSRAYEKSKIHEQIDAEKTWNSIKNRTNKGEDIHLEIDTKWIVSRQRVFEKTTIIAGLFT